MERRKRADLEIEALRQAGDATRRLFQEIREARETRGWTQAGLAARAALSRPVVGRIERDEVDPTLRQLEQLALAFGRPLHVALGRDPGALPADAGHLVLQELVIGLGRRHGFETRFELVTRPAEPWRSADVVLSCPRRRLAIIVECWNVIGDVGAAARSSARKRREAGDLARAAWGIEDGSRLVWAVRATARNRRLLATYPEVFRARFPGSSRGWAATLATGAGPPTEDGLVWVDPVRSRILEWRRPGAGRGSG